MFVVSFRLSSYPCWLNAYERDYDDETDGYFRASLGIPPARIPHDQCDRRGWTNWSPARGWRAKRAISSAERISRAGATTPGLPMRYLCCTRSRKKCSVRRDTTLKLPRLAIPTPASNI